MSPGTSAAGRVRRGAHGEKLHLPAARAARRRWTSISAALASGLTVACATVPSVEGQWLLREIDRSKVEGAQTLTLQNDGTRVTGNAGCNRFQGTASIHAGQMSVGPLASTRKMCEPEVMDREQRYLAALARVQQIQVSDTQLELHDVDGATLLVFARDLPSSP